MKKHQCSKILGIISIFVLLVPLSLIAANSSPSPYIKTTSLETVQKVFTEITQLPTDSPSRIEFFHESMTNLGLTENELQKLVNEGKVTVVYCDHSCGLRTAGMLLGSSIYWRIVGDYGEKELTAYILIDKQWLPWFLLRCGNPVKPINQQTINIVSVVERNNTEYHTCGWQTGQTIVTHPFDGIGNHVNFYFYPFYIDNYIYDNFNTEWDYRWGWNNYQQPTTHFSGTIFHAPIKHTR